LDSVTAVLPDPAEPTTTTGHGKRGTTSPAGSVAGSAGGGSVSSFASSTTAPRRKRDFS
jgi:hypothetical protein